mmetsp:Transcript_114416/g.296345  ORF Transcript_114416/g.296345 Transcript_114416/m.296345 type:complete len:426 (-) Transcript_114416:188-1465(-)
MGHMKSGSTLRRSASSAFRSETCLRTRSRSVWNSDTCTATSSWNCSRVASLRARRSSGERAWQCGDRGWLPALFVSSSPSCSSSSVSSSRGRAASASRKRRSEARSCSARARARSSACVTRNSYCRSSTAAAVIPTLSAQRACLFILAACACRRCFLSSVCAASRSSSAARCSRARSGARRRSSAAPRSSSRCAARRRSFGTRALVHATSWLATSAKRCAAWLKSCAWRRTCRLASSAAALAVAARAARASKSSIAEPQQASWFCRKSAAICWMWIKEFSESLASCVHSVSMEFAWRNWSANSAAALSRSLEMPRHSSSCSCWIRRRPSTALRSSASLLSKSGACAERASHSAPALCCSNARSAAHDDRALRTRCGTRTVRHGEPQRPGLRPRSAASSHSRYLSRGSASGESSNSTMRPGNLRHP